MDDFDSATYSIESEPDHKRIPLDDMILPTVRRSAIQIVSLSPRRQAKRSVPLPAGGDDEGTMQVTKLVLKTPPGSPKRQPKASAGILVKSVQTFAGPGLTGTEAEKPSRTKPVRPKSSPKPSNKPAAAKEECKKKEKSYDPAKAREFMKEQQAKRRLEKKDVPGGAGSNTKGAAEKDLIKKRLETLRQSSQKLSPLKDPVPISSHKTAKVNAQLIVINADEGEAIEAVQKELNLQDGDEAKTGPQTVQQSSNDPHMERSQREQEYQRLLESFNRSLTHVIEVNQQLYSALKNVPSTAAIPPFSQEVIRLRDEITQTSLPIPSHGPPKPFADPKKDVLELLVVSKASGASTTSASNYSDDFEHQSQTEVPPVPPGKPEDKAVTPLSPVSSATTSPSDSSPTSASGGDSSTGSDTADSNNNSSSQSSSSPSLNNEPIESPRNIDNRPETNAEEEESKAKSNTTTAHSSDFDSRSFSLSDSHNNTMNNQPPMPEEYLPSFEESLRRNQLPGEKQNEAFKQHGKLGEEEKEKGQNEARNDVSQGSSISEQLPTELEEEKSYSFKHSEISYDRKVNTVPWVEDSPEESIEKTVPVLPSRNKDKLLYEDNLDATINSDLLAAMFNRTDLEVSILSTTVSETNLSYSSIGMVSLFAFDCYLCILLRREEELRKRKEHVQRLLEWHRKLEREEEELIAVEDRLLAYNSRKLESGSSHTPRKEKSIEARVESIEKSLKILESIPTAVVRKDVELQRMDEESQDHYFVGNEVEEEVVLTRGSKLNRLWYRLTGVKEQRYEPSRNYPVTRLHMAALYEDAKRCVLEGFQRNDVQLKESLLEQSIGINHREGSETVANTTASVEENGSLHTTVAGEETVRIIPQEAELIAKELTDETVKTIEEETSKKEQMESVAQEETDGIECELPPMEDDGGKVLLSSTVNGWSPSTESRRSIESVEFHTLEETSTHFQSALENVRGDDEAPKSESYSITFEEQSNAGGLDATGAEESQLLIEDMSLPPMLLNNTAELMIDDEERATSSSSSSTSSCESSATVELSVPLTAEEKVSEELSVSEGNELDAASSDTSISIAQSLEEISESSSISNVTTPTTVTPTMAIEVMDKEAVSDKQQEVEDERSSELKVPSHEREVPVDVVPVATSESEYEEDVFHTKSSSVSNASHGATSELAKRLTTLHDELEELSETFERTPLMKSPVAAAAASTTESKPDHTEDQNSSEETITFDYDEDGGEITSPSSGGESATKDEEGQSSSESKVVDPNSSKIQVKLRSKVMSSGNDTIAIVSNTNNRDHPAPISSQLQQLYHHTESVPTSAPPPSSSSSPNVGVRMPDIINEAEVLRRQQLQIEQEIKELEQQVGFFREIPNKPPPPYIPPANGSPLALLFPSEARIDELIDGRVEELHRDRIAPETLHSDHVTNVYEKLILDMCKEFYRDLRPAEPTVSFRTIPHDKRPLVFHNPPDPLRCMKDYLRVKIRRVLNDAQVALQQQQHQHQQHQLLLHHQLQQQQQPHPSHSQLQHHHHLLHHHHGHCAAAAMPFLYGNGCASKRKPDQVDEILKQETHDDDARWTNFDREEIEVKDRITEELLKSLLMETLKDMGEAYERKMRKTNALAKRQESAM
uniref:Uncharacterized protein n=1 Tax=Anopheles epiroticus TaxID=199890 RepID=A0A182P2W1_9DIPT